MSEENKDIKIDDSREAIEDIEKTVEDLKRKIQEISAEEEAKASDGVEIPSFADSTKAKIAEIRENTLKTVNKSLEDIKTVTNEKASTEDMKKSLEFIKENAKKAVDSAFIRIDDLKKNPDVQKGFQDAKTKATDMFNKASIIAKDAAETTKNKIDEKLTDDQKKDIKEASDKASKALNSTAKSVSKSVESFMSNPDVQEFGQKSKDFAEKGINSVKNFLNKNDQPEKEETENEESNDL